MEFEKQKGQVYQHMKLYGSITSMEAFSMYNITRLSSIIHKLRHNHDIPIAKVMHYETKQDGTRTNYARYYIGK